MAADDDDDQAEAPLPTLDQTDREVLRVLSNLSLSLNGLAYSIRDQTRALHRLGGIPPGVRSHLGRGLRVLRDEIGGVADVVDPPGAVTAR